MFCRRMADSRCDLAGPGGWPPAPTEEPPRPLPALFCLADDGLAPCGGREASFAPDPLAVEI